MLCRDIRIERMSIAADYVYSMTFDGGKIRHMTKIWNDAVSLRQLGWT